MSRRTLFIIAGIILVSILTVIVVTAALIPSSTHPAFAAAVAFMAAAGKGDDTAAEAFLSPDMLAYVAANCPDGSTSACVDQFTPLEWGDLVSAVFRRAVPDGTNWNVDLIATYQFGTGFSGVCIYHRMEQDQSVFGKSLDGRDSSTVAIPHRVKWLLTPKRRSRPMNEKTLRLIIFLLFAGCVPSEIPAVLNQTPGAPIIVDGERYTNAIFSVSIPAGWRVITTAAESAPAVTLVAPDNCTLIHLSTVPAEAPVAPACDQPTQTLRREVTFGNLNVYVAGSAPISTWDAFIVILDHTIESLQTED